MNIINRLNSLPQAQRTAILSRIKNHGLDYGLYPLTVEQYGIWCSYRLSHSGQNPFYNLCFKLTIENGDLERAKQSIDKLFHDNSVFSYLFFELDGKVYQYLDNDSQPNVLVKDFSNLDDNTLKTSIKKLEITIKSKSFNLEYESPVMFTLLKLPNSAIVFYACIHHIVCDAWSLGVTARKFLDYYFNGDVRRDTNFSFEDFLLEESSMSLQNRRKANLSYWEDVLKDIPQSLPFNYAEYNSHANTSESYTFNISTQLTYRLRELSKETRFSLQTILLTGFAILIRKYFNAQNFCIGITTARREDSKLNDIIGDFAGVLPLPISFNKNASILGTMNELHTHINDAIEHQHISITELLNDTLTIRSLNVNPLYQVMFALHSTRLTGGIVAGKPFELGSNVVTFDDLPYIPVDNYPMFLCVSALELEDTLRVTAEYSKAWLTSERVENLMNLYIYVLETITKGDTYTVDNIDFNVISENIATTDYVPMTILGSTKSSIFPKVCARSSNGYVAIVDTLENGCPIDFYGNVVFSQDGTLWHYTGEYGKFSMDGSLHVDRTKSKALLLNGNLVIIPNMIEQLAQNGINITSYQLFEPNLLVLKHHEDSKIYPNDVYKVTDVKVPMVCHESFPISDNTMYRISNAIENIYNLGINDVMVLPVDSEIILVCSNVDIQKLPSLKSVAERLSRSVKLCTIENFESINYGDILSSGFNYIETTFPNETEQRVFNVWKSILGNDNFSLNDKFYEVGGNSTRMMQLYATLQSSFNTEVSIAELFTHSTIKEMASLLSSGNTNIGAQNTPQGIKF